MLSKKLALILFAAFTAMISMAQDAIGADWIKFTSESGKFSVLMPGPDQPKVVENIVWESKDSPAAAPYTTHLIKQVSENGVIFLVGWVDYAQGYSVSPQAELFANRDNFVKGVKAKLTYERAIKLGQMPGLEFTCENDAGVVSKARVYMVNMRPYMLVASTPKGRDDSVNIERFFASFRMQDGGSH